MSKNEIATAKTTAVGSVLDFAMDAGLGAENADTASFALPFLQILQGLSPKIESVDGAKPGLFINTITDELFKECLVIPCYYQRRFYAGRAVKMAAAFVVIIHLRTWKAGKSKG